MDEKYFREWIDRILPTLKLFVAWFKDWWRSFINHLNSLDKNLIQKFYDEYDNYKVIEKINRVRRNILAKLLKWPITLDEANAIFDDEKQLWGKNQLWVWTIPRIIYPFCYWENRSEERHTRDFLIELCNDVIEKAWYDKTKISDPWQVSFDWANNFGKNWFYVAFWNNSHPDYTTSDQFRIESKGDDKLRVWIYHHKKWFIDWQHKTFDLDKITLQDVINEAIECKDIVENDMYTWPVKQDSNNQNTTLSTPSKTMKSVPLNTILYWVPGTWKTYNTVNYAVSAIEGKNLEDVSREEWTEVKKRYDQYKSEWQIVFTTFHQSFGYEDFIEWIKAKVEPNWNINYEIKPWIFKSLCEVAESEDNVVSVQSNVDVDKVKVFKMSLWEAWVEDSIYDYCIENNVVALGFWDMDFTELDKKAKPKDIKEFIRKKDPNADTWFVVDAIFRFKSWMDAWDLVIISRWNLYLRAIWRVTSEYFYDENSPLEYKHFRKVEWIVKDVDIPVERINTKNFSQQSIYNLKDDWFKKETTLKLDELKKIIWVSKSAEKRNYVLIIDEINRWNISKIFWELITLIEPNKRLGNPEQIKVKLPYSQKEFWVPSNLFIIWTMNTADRSIALMDLALRRRFSFNEIEPDSSLLDWITVDWINIKELFETYNKRIEFLYDRDHLLWHAYFLPLKEEPTLWKLNHIVLDKVIPLLQEYFHDDWEKIQLILWEGLIYSENLIASDILGKNTGDYEDHPDYKINLNPSAWDYNI